MIKTKDRIPLTVEAEDYIRVPMLTKGEYFEPAFIPRGVDEVDVFKIVQEALKNSTNEWIYVPLARMRMLNELY